MTVVVTGGARGIGLGVVDLLLEQGDRVVVVDVNVEPLLGRESDQLALVEGDVTEVRVIEEACRLAGPITGVVASAGISRPGPSDDYPTEQWNAILALNLTAVFELMRIAARTATDGASFVAISSVTGMQGFAGRAAYSASKAGVDGLVRALAAEYAPKVRVNAVVPGFVMTDIARANIASGVIDDELVLDRTPMGRWGTPSDIAKAIGFLLGDESSWVTGASIPVDGGWLSFGLGSEQNRPKQFPI